MIRKLIDKFFRKPLFEAGNLDRVDNALLFELIVTEKEEDIAGLKDICNWIKVKYGFEIIVRESLFTSEDTPSWDYDSDCRKGKWIGCGCRSTYKFPSTTEKQAYIRGINDTLSFIKSLKSK